MIYRGTYKGLKVESSLPLDSIIFQSEEEPEKPTPAEEKQEETKTVSKRAPRKR